MLRKLALLIGLLSLVGSELNSQAVRLREAGAAPVAPPGDSPISDNARPRMGVTETAKGKYNADTMTVAEWEDKVDGYSHLRRIFAEAVAELDTTAATDVARDISCTTGVTPAVCTWTGHGMATSATGVHNGYYLVFAGHTSTPSLNSNYVMPYGVTANTFEIYSYPAGTAITLTANTADGVVTYLSPDRTRERAMIYGAIYQLATAGTLRNEADSANVTLGLGSAAAYGDKCVDLLRVQPNQTLFGDGQNFSNEGLSQFTPWALDWCWNRFASNADAYVICDFLGNSTGSSHYGDSHEFKGSRVNIQGYLLNAAVACANTGDVTRDAFWQGILDKMTVWRYGSTTAFVDALKAYNGGVDSVMFEADSYSDYNFAPFWPGVAAYRIGMGHTLDSFYGTDPTDWGYYVYSSRMLWLRSKPYAMTGSTQTNGYTRGFLRLHYGGFTVNDNGHPGQIVNFAPSIIQGELKNLLTTAGQAGLHEWFSENRTYTGSSTLMTGQGPGFQAGVSGVFASIFGDESASASDPSTGAGSVSLSYYLTNSMHIFSTSLTNTVGAASKYVFHTEKWHVGVSNGRSPSLNNGTEDMEFWGGPVTAGQGGVAHFGRPGSFIRQMFPLISRVRDACCSDTANEIGDVREENINGVLLVDSADDFVEDNIADFDDEHLYKVADTANGDYFDWVHYDNSDAYVNRDAVVSAGNPKVIDLATTDIFFVRGASATDPIRRIRFDRWDLLAAKVGVNEPIFNMVPAWEPTMTGGSAPSSVTRNGQSYCQDTYGSATGANWKNNTAQGGSLTYDVQGNFTILAPSSRNVVLRGGPNNSNVKWDYGGTPCEAVDPYGLQWGIHFLTANYTGHQSGEYGPFMIEIIDTSGAETGYFATCLEGLTYAGTPVSAALVSGTGGFVGVRCGNAIAITHEVAVATSPSLTGTWTIAADNGEDYQMMVTSVGSGSLSLTCTNVSSFTQVDPTDTSSPYTFTANGTATFTFTSTVTGNIVCTR
jgi:hypothetical protein